VAAPDRFIAWCKQEQASIEQQLELLQAAKVRTGEDIGAGWIDTTDESIERARARLSELNDLLTEAGKSTVINPARSSCHTSVSMCGGNVSSVGSGGHVALCFKTHRSPGGPDGRCCSRH
jgi:hypothetical protein